ncbi:MAG: ADP-forming succinate--CoA ligase subunit beta, partial [Deltaproteobacteria bacterium]|nr:ADP-forming succinate--CoA ligase subunit beta [Deltaproteobacteria bacterium]
MRLFEYEAKEIFQKNGIPVPRGGVAGSVEEAARIFTDLGSAVVKSQVLVGGRGKAGGIQYAENRSELEEKVRRLLGSEIRGFVVNTLLIEERLSI